MTLTRTQRRAWFRLKCGLQRNRRGDHRLRFLTLTLKKGPDRDIMNCWNKMKGRIRRKFKVFEYFLVRVEHQHLHLLFFGSFMPQSWLSNAWLAVTGDSPVVDIRACKVPVHNSMRLANYAIKQYVLGQDGEVRFQMSRGWVYRGFMGDWHKIKAFFNYEMFKAVDYLNRFLETWLLIMDLDGNPHRKRPAMVVQGRTKEQNKVFHYALMRDSTYRGALEENRLKSMAYVAPPEMVLTAQGWVDTKEKNLYLKSRYSN